VTASGTIKVSATYFGAFWGSGKMKPGDFSSVNNKRRPIGLLIIAANGLFCAAFSDVSVAANRPAVSPNQDFSNPMFQLRAPASTGWYGVAQSSTHTEFGKSGSSANESFVAAVILFRHPTFENADAFTGYVREGVVKDSPSDRFEVIESSVQYSSEREYACVRYHGISNDLKTRTSGFFRRTMRLEVVALYCEYPPKPGVGFMVSFSHRGGSADVKIDDDAASFINSVQVTAPIKTP
jgi:hypothetical protein